VSEQRPPFETHAPSGNATQLQDYRNVAAIVVALGVLQAGTSALSAFAPLTLLARRESAPAIARVAGDWIEVEGVVEGTVEQINFFAPRSFGGSTSVLSMFRTRAYRTIPSPTSRACDTAASSGPLVSNMARRNNSCATCAGASRTICAPAMRTFAHLRRRCSFRSLRSPINLMIYCFTRTNVWGEWLALKQDLALTVKRIVEDEGASFAFPTRTLQIVETPGDWMGSEAA
jgi:hypothetical protein